MLIEDQEQDLENENIEDEQGQEEIQKSDVDYQALYEEQKKQNEIIENEKRRIQSLGDTAIARLNKFRKVINENKVAEVDEDFNVVIKKSTTVEVDPIQEIDNQIRSLAKKFENDEIEAADYYDKLTDLKMDRRELQRTSPTKKESKETEKENKGIEEHFQDVRRQLGSEYPDSEIEGSPLFNAMVNLITADKKWNNADKRFDKNPYDRRKLIEAALDKMGKPEGDRKMDTKPQNKKAPHSFDKPSQQREKPQEDLLKKYEAQGIIRVKGLDPAKRKDLEARVAQIENLTREELFNNQVIHQ